MLRFNSGQGKSRQWVGLKTRNESSATGDDAMDVAFGHLIPAARFSGVRQIDTNVPPSPLHFSA